MSSVTDNIILWAYVPFGIFFSHFARVELNAIKRSYSREILLSRPHSSTLPTTQYSLTGLVACDIPKNELFEVTMACTA